MAFVATNIDDLFVLMIFFANKDYKNNQIVIGQYLGVSFLILISLLGYFFKFIVPMSVIGLLGIFPIIIGLKSLIDLKNRDKEDEIGENLKSKGSSIFTVTFVSFINGGDNIGVYTPLFATLDIYQLFVMVVVFMTMIGIWCLISQYLTNHRVIGDKIKKYGHLIFPFVLIALGIYIILSNIILY
ncbi:cadmium resistance transporter [Methanobacterium oryzae]|uniref:cadmium resistance transporter n=1 Tax=Methanobacterium oryzae TaxID=69540 RepID=UPI003D1B17B9